MTTVSATRDSVVRVTLHPDRPGPERHRQGFRALCVVVGGAAWGYSKERLCADSDASDVRDLRLGHAGLGRRLRNGSLDPLTKRRLEEPPARGLRAYEHRCADRQQELTRPRSREVGDGDPRRRNGEGQSRLQAPAPRDT